MRIVHLIPGLMTGGSETMLINIANEQATNHSVMVIIFNQDYDRNLLMLFSEQVKLKLINRPVSSKNPWYVLKLNWTIFSFRPQIVHSHLQDFIYIVLRIGYKYVYTIHDTNIEAKELKKHQHMIAISKAVQQDVEKRTKMHPQLIYNGIIVDSFKKKSFISVPHDLNFKIVQVSRLMHMKKGQLILIQAIEILNQRGYDNIVLDLIGEGESRSFLEKYVKEHFLTNIHFLGNKSVVYISQNLCNYDLFVQPSLFEGFGLTVAEAMAAKVPVLVSQNEGPLEIIDGGKYGYTFENGSIEDCANKIEQIMNMNHEEVYQETEKAFEHVKNHFNIKTTSKKYIQYYRSCE